PVLAIAVNELRVAATAEHEQLRLRAIFDLLSHGNQRRTAVGQQHQSMGCSLTVEGLQSNAMPPRRVPGAVRAVADVPSRTRNPTRRVPTLSLVGLSGLFPPTL